MLSGEMIDETARFRRVLVGVLSKPKAGFTCKSCPIFSKVAKNITISISGQKMAFSKWPKNKINIWDTMTRNNPTGQSGLTGGDEAQSQHCVQSYNLIVIVTNRG